MESGLWVIKKRYLFRWMINFSVGFFRSISSLFHVRIFWNFGNRSMIMLFSPIVLCACETYLIASCQMLILSDRSENAGKFDCFQVSKFRAGVVGQLQKKSSYSMRTIFRSDLLWMCRVSAMMITSTFPFAFCNGSTSSEHISTVFSSPPSWTGMCQKMMFGSPKTNTFFSFIENSSVNCHPFLERIKYLNRISNCFLARSIRGNHNVHNCLTV